MSEFSILTATQDDINSFLQSERLGTTPIPEQAGGGVSDYEGFATELFEGLASGVTKVPEGVLTTIALVPDLLFGTEYASDIENEFRDFRSGLGIDPTGLAGGIGETVTQFIIPGGVAAKAVGNLLKTTSKAGKLGKLGSQMAAFGVADIVTATDDTTVIADFFDGGPLGTKQNFGEEGREEAIRRILNKLKIGGETAALTGFGGLAVPAVKAAADVKIGTLPTVSEVTSRTVMPVLQKGAEKITSGRDYINKRLAEMETRVVTAPPNVDRSLKDVTEGVLINALSKIRARGILPEESEKIFLNTSNKVAAEMLRAKKNTDSLEASLKDVQARVTNFSNDASLTSQRDLELKTEIEDYLFSGRTDPSKLSPEFKSLKIIDTLDDIRNQIDELGEKLLKSDFVKLGIQNNIFKDRDIINEFRKNTGKYKRRTYEAFLNPDKHSFDNLSDIDKEIVIKGFQKDKRNTQRILREANQPLSQTGDITEEQAIAAAKLFLGKYQKSIKNFDGDNTNFNYKPGVGGGIRQARKRFKTDMFIKRQNIPKFQRVLLGEVRDPIKNALNTVEELSRNIALDGYFARIRRLADDGANPGISKLFVNPNAAKPDGYVTLGSKQGNSMGLNIDETPNRSGWGSLHGYHVPERVYKDLTYQINDFGKLQDFYGYFLRAKGLSQIGKTALSLPTQARNVLGGSLFAVANGNVGRGVNILDSLKKTYASIPVFKSYGLGEISKEELAKQTQRYVELGVTDSNPVLNEAFDNLTGVFAKDSAVKTINVNGQEVDVKLFGTTNEGLASSGFQNNLSGSSDSIKKGVVNIFEKTGAKTGFDTALQLYKAGDDLWKIYGFEFEKNKILNAFRNNAQGSLDLNELSSFLTRKGIKLSGNNLTRDAVLKGVDEYAADVIRNTVPNYGMAPEAIKFGRKLPLGNFITFPYEILRTGMNMVSRGLDELADPNKEIQKIGLRRLTGVTATHGTLGLGLAQLGYHLSDVSREEVEAYKKTMAPPWEKNSILIPTNREKDGSFSYVNFSYFNPYDFVVKMAEAGLNSFTNARDLGQDPLAASTKAVVGSASEFFSPFVSESILTEALADVSFRGGRSNTGAKIYNQEDTFGDKVMKGFFHSLNSVLPGVFPAEFNTSKPGSLPILGIQPVSIEPSGFSRAFASKILPDYTSSKDRNGIEKEIDEELFSLFTGVTERKAQIPRALKYKGYEFARERQNASNAFNRIARQENVSPSSLYNAYLVADEQRFRAFNKFKNVLDTAKTLKLSDTQIKKILKDANVFGVDEVIKGRYEPLPISSNLLKQMKTLGTDALIPVNQIKQYRKQKMLEPLTPRVEEVVEERTPIELLPVLNFDLLKSPPPLSSGLPVTRPTLGQERIDLTTIDREALAGGNPATQQIARR